MRPLWLPAFHSMTPTPTPSRLWRQRLAALRGMLVITLGLAYMGAWMHALSPMPMLTTVIWLTLLWLPSLLLLLTRHQPERQQQRWLLVETCLDTVLFIGLLYQLGGAGNPLVFYLLVPVLVASLSQSPLAATTVAALACLCYASTALWAAGHHHHNLHGLSDISRSHELGMWLVFVVLSAVFVILGQALQRAARQQQRQQAMALDVALQRERMYQVAADFADRAHELNTPLATMMLMTEDPPAADPALLARDWQQLHGLCQRMASLLKTPEPELAPTRPLSALVERLRRNLRMLAPTLVVRWQGPEDPELGPSTGWQRILANLGYNACDAGATLLDIRCQASADHWLIQLADNGPQRHDGQRQHQGLGLGLTLVETTLTALGGHIELLQERHWTVARITLPRTAPERP